VRNSLKNSHTAESLREYATGVDNFHKQFTGKRRGDFEFKWDEKKRGAWQNHKRLPYISINVYRTSLDHLLLGMDADIDRMSTGPIIKPFWAMSKIEFWIVAIFKMNRNRVTRTGGQWVSRPYTRRTCAGIFAAFETSASAFP
jgi:hypothetical protein